MRFLLPCLLLAGCTRAGMRAPGSARHFRGDADAYSPASETSAASETPTVSHASPPRGSGSEEIAVGAATLIGRSRLTVEESSFRYDCSGMVCAAYATAGLQLSGSSKSLYAEAEQAGILHTDSRPAPGDIAFFDNSYDRNRNGRRDDMLTHVAVVESVDAEGTITLIHLGSGRVGRIQMNLERPDEPGVNSYLRAPSDRDGGPRLTGELWRAFGSFWALSEEDGSG